MGDLLVDSKGTCFGNYTPCSCYKDDAKNALIVTCDQVLLDDVKEIFDNNPYGDVFKEFYLHISENETAPAIPANLLSNNKAVLIDIACPSDDFVLDAHPDAFRASADNATEVILFNCDARRLDWRFLNGLDAVEDIRLMHMLNLEGFRKMGKLSASLTSLTVNAGSGLSDLPEVTSPSMHLIDLSNNRLRDEEIAKIIRTLAVSPAAESLSHLRLDGNLLSKMPNNLETLRNLTDLAIQDNDIRRIGKGELAFSSNVSYISLTGDHIQTIQPGAFKGKLYNESLLQLYYRYGSFVTFSIWDFRLLWRSDDDFLRQPVGSV